MAAMVRFAWPSLPEEPPMHFHASGLPNRYGHSFALFLLLALTAEILQVARQT